MNLATSDKPKMEVKDSSLQQTLKARSIAYLNRTVAIFHSGGLSSKAFTNPDPMSESLEKFKRQVLVKHKVRRLISLFGFF